MRYAIILLVVIISALFAGCVSQEKTAPVDQSNAPPQVSDAAAVDQSVAQIDSNLVSDTDEVEIGEMI